MSNDNKSGKSPKKEPDKIHPDEKVCYNCKHLNWLVGVGMGIRCSLDRNSKGFPNTVPSRRHTCDRLEKKTK